MAPSGAERPRVDHPVDRPELYGLRGLEVTGTNGRSLDRFYRRPSNLTVRRPLDRSVIRSISRIEIQEVFSTREPAARPPTPNDAGLGQNLK